MSLELQSQLPEDNLGELADDSGGVLAHYRDDKTATETTLTAGDQAKPKRLTHLYASKASAPRGGSGVVAATRLLTVCQQAAEVTLQLPLSRNER